MRYFVTGHTGFKGSWLVGLLTHLGQEVSGYSLNAEPDSLFDRADLEELTNFHFEGDIRDKLKLKSAIEKVNPDVIVHLAAQPLVLESYKDPETTYTTNVNGTLNLLAVLTELNFSGVALIVTTDKVYLDSGKGVYCEDDPLGGFDPYSASKAMADLMTQSWMKTNPELKIIIARAGNVVGPFDSAPGRLIPDILKAYSLGSPLEIRNIDAVRPWQHVLDCLGGYLRYIDCYLKNPSSTPTILNFGPPETSMKTVGQVIQLAEEELGGLQRTKASSLGHETKILSLDSSLAQRTLGWANKFSFEETVRFAIQDSFGAPRETLMHRAALYSDR